MWAPNIYWLNLKEAHSFETKYMYVLFQAYLDMFLVISYFSNILSPIYA